MVMYHYLSILVPTRVSTLALTRDSEVRESACWPTSSDVSWATSANTTSNWGRCQQIYVLELGGPSVDFHIELSLNVVSGPINCSAIIMLDDMYTLV